MPGNISFLTLAICKAQGQTISIQEKIKTLREVTNKKNPTTEEVKLRETFSEVGGYLYQRVEGELKLVAPRRVQGEIFNFYHPLAGIHPSVKVIMRELSYNFFWPGMLRDIRSWDRKKCPKCSRQKLGARLGILPRIPAERRTRKKLVQPPLFESKEPDPNLEWDENDFESPFSDGEIEFSFD